MRVRGWNVPLPVQHVYGFFDLFAAGLVIVAVKQVVPRRGREGNALEQVERLGGLTPIVLGQSSIESSGQNGRSGDRVHVQITNILETALVHAGVCGSISRITSR